MMNGPGGRVRPVVAAPDRHRPAERGDVPVDGRRHLSAGREPYPHPPPTILPAPRGAQSLPPPGMGHAIALAADAAALARQRGGVGAEVEEEARDLTLALILGSAREEAMQTEAAHQRAVDEEKLSRHGGEPRSPGGPARS